jgi:hypothetical protein
MGYYKATIKILKYKNNIIVKKCMEKGMEKIYSRILRKLL